MKVLDYLYVLVEGVAIVVIVAHMLFIGCGCSTTITHMPDPAPCRDKFVPLAELDAPTHKEEEKFVWQSTLPKRAESDPRFTGEPYDPLKEMLR